MGLVVFMASLDMSIVHVALPQIQQTFGAPASTVQWVVLGYLLPLLALALPAGRWLDTVDRGAALIWACAGFAVASLAAGLAPTIGWLIAARIVQGMAGTVLMNLIPVLITTSVDPRVRGRAMGVVDTMGMLGLISGPGIGGLIVASMGWPWIFYVNVPVCAALIALAVRRVPRAGRIRLSGRSTAIEALLLTTGTVVVMLAFTLASGRTPYWLILGLTAVPLLLVWHRLPVSRHVRELVRLPAMRRPLTALATTATATGLLFYMVPFYLATVLRTPAPVTGLTMLALPLAAAALGPLAGLLADRYGYLKIAMIGMVTMICGLLTLASAAPTWHATDVAWRLALTGIGIGLFNAPNMSAAMSAAPRSLVATAGAATSLARQGGFALGPAAATLVWGLSGFGVDGFGDAFAVAAVIVGLGLVPLPDRAPENPADSGETAGRPPGTGR
ncbi:MFS transporter [Actinoplanes xinjiangensis]|nr:MFS transporter [Actinoplanes xinjiangensis]